nr:hypothetical protein [Bacteroides sp.]
MSALQLQPVGCGKACQSIAERKEPLARLEPLRYAFPTLGN